MKREQEYLDTIRHLESQLFRWIQYLSMKYQGTSSLVPTKEYPEIAKAIPGGHALYPSLAVIHAPGVEAIVFPVPDTHITKFHHLNRVGPVIEHSLTVEDYTERYSKLYALGERYISHDDVLDFL